MKKHLSKRLIALLLTLAMVLTLVPMVFAEETQTDEYVLATELHDGDKVVIVNPASGKAISNADSDAANNPERYRLGVDVAAADGKLSEPEAQLVWTVEVTEDGTAFKDADGKYLSTPANYANLVLDSECRNWTVSAAATADSVYIISTESKGSEGDLRGIEFFGGKFTTYYASESNLASNEEAFALQLYVLKTGEEPVDPPVEKELSGKTVILHTNDTHGALLGFAQVAKVKADYEAKGANVILVDAGDYSQGTTYVSTNKGEAAITMMNAAGYDLVTLGNHEFDFGYAQLKSNLEKAEFEVICADVLSKENGASVFRTRVIKEIDGVKIGFFGMETPETFTKVNPGLIQEITFPQGEEMYHCAQEEVNWLKEEGADLIIGLVHLGVDDESAPNRSIDLYEHVTDIDFLIDGHSHTVMTKGPNDEPIQSTGTKASKTALMNVGLIQIDNATKTIEKNELIPLGEEAPVDETVAAVAQEIMDAVDAEYGAKFATSEVELNGDKAPGNRNMETNLGDLITDALRWGVLKDLDAETLGVPEENVVALTNGGGIRAWIHVGDVTKNDVNTVLPFGNTVAVVYVTGAELLEALEASTYSTPGAIGGFPQVAGMKFTIKTRHEYDKGEQYPDSTYYGPASIQRVTIDEIGGKPFDPEAVYAVVTNNFCAAGGDTYYAFKAASNQFDTGIPMDEMLMDYIGQELGGVIGEAYAEPQGRIVIDDYFDDVTDPGKYYFEPVYWAVAQNPPITSGLSSNLFGPGVSCTREQVVTFLYAAAGKPEVEAGENPFQDVKEGKWYYDAVMWAVQNDITSGMGDDTFGIGVTCTRAQVVTFLWAAAGKPAPKTTEHPFTDVKAGGWYEEAVLWAVENKVTGGTSDTTFSPNNQCTRGQIVTFLYAAKTKDLVGKTVILHTNDTHGALLGFAQVAAVKKAYEKRGADVILMDAGDYSQGTIYVSTNKGEAAVTMLNAAGYDFVTLGNHEFDYGYAQLVANMEKAEFQPIVADVLLKETGKSIFDGHVIKEVGGVKIGIFGMETPETFTKVNPGLIQEITFPQGEEMYACAKAEVDALKEEGADLIIGLLHLGVDAESEPNRSIDLYENVTGIDFIIDGHSHTVMTEGPNGEPIQSTGTKDSETALMNVGLIQIDNATKTIEKNELIPLGADAPVDEAVAAVAQEIMDEIDSVYNAKFAESKVELNGDKAPNGNRDSETNLGDLITDAMLWGVGEIKDQNGNTVPAENVVAITNGGGIRAWIHAGDVTMKNVNTVLPFGNTVTVVLVKGDELLEALEASTYAVPGPIGGFPQIAGMKITVDTTKEYDKGEQYPNSTYYGPASIQRVTIDEIGGKPFDHEAVYAVVTNNFCSAGGDTYYAFKAASYQFDTSLPLDEVLMNYITEEMEGVIDETYAEPQGRITINNGETSDEIIIGGLEPNVWTTKYGNIYTNCTADKLEELGYTYGDILTVKFLDQELELPLVPTFSYVDQGTPGAFINKNAETGKPEGYLFFAINMGDFTTTYGIATKTTNPDKTWFWTANEGVTFPIVVTLEMKEQGGYLDDMLLRDINRTNNREDYPELSDEEFANFRRITTTGMGDHLYRGSSPINPEIGRNTYADAALENAGVTVIMNLANDQATAEGYEGYADTYYSQQNIVFLNLGVDFQAEDFQAGLAVGLRHFAENQGVYYVHCTEGKDRAGFVSALLECLMGATCEEVVADYLKTYTNYYTVVDGVQQPLSQETLNAIAESNIIKTLKTAFGVEDLTTADLAAEAEEYIKQIGLNDDEIAALKTNLSGETAPLEGFLVLKDGANMLKYGHIDLDISAADFLEQFELGDIVTVTVNGFTFDAPVVTNYDDVDTGAYLIRCASGKTVTTLAINYGQIGVAAGIIEAGPEGSNPKYVVKEGLEWPMYATIVLKEAGGYADELSIRQLTRTNVRSDYDDLSDAEFANFRVVGTTGMGSNALYRSSSPIDPELGRNTYADAAAEAAGVKTFINLADTEEEAAAFEGYTDSYYSTQTKLFLGLPVAFTSDEFKAGLANGYKFITTNDGPYLIHCLEGKDRTGLSVGVLECLMGASLEEIQTDYLKTYENYFEVQNNEHIALTEAQVTYLKGIITKNLGIIFDVEDMTTADLAAEADAYLTEIGLTDEEIATLKTNLGKTWEDEETTGPAFVKLTEAPEDWTKGSYLLVYEADEGTGKVFNGADGTNGASYDVVAIEDGVIAYDEALFTVSFETMEGGYAIHTANGYMGNTGSSNGVTTASSSQLLNELSFDANGLLLKCNARYFRFNKNNGNDRFRYFNDNSTNNAMPIPAVYVLMNAG